MKRLYLCAMLVLLFILALSGSANSQTLTGRIWIDANNNGKQDDGAANVKAGVSVTLYRLAEGSTDAEEVDHSATAADGTYSITIGPQPDKTDFYAVFQIPVGYTLAKTDVQNENVDSDFYPDESNAGYAKTENFQLPKNPNQKINYDGGLVPSPASLGGLIWNDGNHNESQDGGETGIPNITVELHKCSDGSLADSKTSDANGNYLFSGINPGEYYLLFVTPMGYSVSHLPYTIDPAQIGKTICFTLTPGQSNQAANAGIYLTPPSPATLTGFAWIDPDGDGKKKQNPGDPNPSPLGSVPVELFNSSNVSQGTTSTDTDGKYTFSGISAGSYYVQFTAPEGYEFTKKEGQLNSDNNSDVDETSGKTGEFTLAAGENLTNVDVGLKVKTPPPPQTGSIGDYVWEDNIQNGNQDETGNPGINNVKVELYSHSESGDTYFTETTTNGNGHYKFDNVPAGTYRVKFYLASGYTQFAAKVDNLEVGNNSDADPSDGFTAAFTLAAGENIEYVDAGMIKEVIPPALGSIGDMVWVDEDNSGTKENNEKGLKDVLVDLYMYQTGNADPVWKANKKTDDKGNYLFSDLEAGTYLVKFTLPNGYEFTQLGSTQDDDDNSDADKNNQGKTKDIILAPGQNRVNIDAGLFVPQLPPANPNPQINGILWVDANGDGFQGGVATEPGLGGWTVKLLGSDQTTVVGTTTTSTSTDPGQTGRYSFTSLSAGTYYIQFVNPGGYTFTLQNAVNDNRDSDVNSVGLSGPVVITDNAREEHVDAGVYSNTQPPSGNAKISGRLWDDTYDKDGLQGGISDEPGIGNQLVELYLSDGTLYKSMNTKSTGGAGDIGTYRFENVAAGSYYVKFYLPSGYSFTLKDAGNDQKDSDADRTTGQTDNYTVINNAEITHIDAGAIRGEIETGSIGDYVWLDTNGNGKQDNFEPGVSSVTVELYRWDGIDFAYKANTATNGSGYYLFSNLIAGTYKVHFIAPSGYKFTARNGAITITNNSDADPAPGTDYGYTVSFLLDPSNSLAKNITYVDAGLISIHGGSIGDLVWYDKDCDGIQDLTEKGVGYVEVRLYAYDNGHSTFMRETLTDEYGRYTFYNLEAGTYRVKFILPGGYEKFTLMDVDENHHDAVDSDADHDGWTAPVTLSQGENDDDVDAGLCKTVCENASIGDLVWNDCNRNGIQDAGETGIECVEVKLHYCTSDHSNANDPCGCGDLVADTKTDKTGKYLFSHLKPGYYCVEIVVPCGFTITKPDQTDDWKDSDVIPSMKHTGCIKLDCEANMTVDAGLYPTPPATIGDLVWIDANKNGIQDNGEKGLCNVNVELYMCGVAKPVAAAKTDSDGKYIFKNIVPSTSYSVKFYLPKGYTFTALDQGNNDSYDSDVCPYSGITKYYDVMPDETNLTIDAGMYLSTTTACNYIWKDNNNNGVKDDGEQGIQGVTVELYQCSNSTMVQSVKTDAAGLFTFKDILLDSYYLKITVPDGLKMGKASQDGGTQGFSPDFGTNGQSTCFDVTSGTTSIGRPVALVLSTTGIARGSEIPTEFSLQQNYPNPFNPSTTIEFAVPSAGQYTLKVFNMLGQEVATLLDRELPVGYHMVVFDASRMPSGMYIYRLTGSNVLMTKKMMLSK